MEPLESRPLAVSRRSSLATGVLLALGLIVGGCRQVPPKTPLAHTFDSPESLAQAVLDSIAHGDLESLKTLALSEQEFREHVWPELPASRPERNLPFEYVWGQLKQRSDQFLAQTLGRYGGQRLELIGVEFEGESTRYETFVVRRDSVLRVRNVEGVESKVKIFGSVLVQSAKYKIFSFVAD